MKTYNQFFLFIFCIVTVLFSITSGCMPVDSEESIAQLTFINDDKISFDKEGGIQTFELESNLNWTLIKEDNATWFEINPNKGTSGKTLLTIETSANNGASRKGTFNITSTSLEKRITIFQKGDGSIEEDDGEFITINEIKSLYDRKEQEVYRFSEPLYLEAIVISDREATNRSSQRDGFIQDKTGAGIAFRVSQSIHTFDLGDKLLIDLKGASLLYFGGYLQLNFSEKLASVLSTNHIVIPNEIDIDELVGADLDGTLIKLKDVQFDSTKPTPFHIKGNFTNHTLEDCNGNNLQVKTFKNATFKDELLPLGKGNMVGIAALIDDDYHIHLRNIEDIEEMNDDLETRCSYTIPDDPTSPYITVEKEEFYCSEKRSTHIIHVLSNSEWMATCSATWVAITQPNGYNDGSIQFTVDANNGNKREATITITDGSIIQSVTVIQHGAEEKPATVATDLFFSEYLEGTSYNKYLEIFNGTGADVDLSDYKVELYVNGQTQAKSIEYLDGILKNNDVIVIGHSSAYIYDEEVITSSVTNFNGNDAIALVKISTAEYVDIFGRIGEDPGKAWETSNLDENFGTMDRTLVRKSSVRSGITKNPTRGFPTLGTEWIPYPLNSVDNLGYHIMD